MDRLLYPYEPGNPKGNFQNRPIIVSPDILKDNRVVFRLYAPKADTVKLVCDWMQGAESRVNMAKTIPGYGVLQLVLCTGVMDTPLILMGNSLRSP